MKKRIGTKLYDTESAELVSESVFGKLYRKRTREREWFLLSGDQVLPMSEKEARAMLGETTYHEKPIESKRVMIGVDRETHSKIARMAKAEGLSISETVRKIVLDRN